MTNKRQIDAAVYQGSRANQQDYVARLVSQDRACVIGILSDGVGGHGHGNHASKIVVDCCVEMLEHQIDSLAGDAALVPGILKGAAEEANRRLAKTIAAFPQTSGMGATLVIAVAFCDQLFWCSIGDSHLKLYRKKNLQRINADHSLASGLDNLLKIGAIKKEAARKSNLTNILTSALSGGVVKDIDCPTQGTPLQKDDVILLASDGIETLDDDKLAEVFDRSWAKTPAELCGRVVQAVNAKAEPTQDNLSIIAIL